VSYDATHSYYVALIANIGAMIIATLLLATLGTYVYAKGAHAEPGALPEAAVRA
jgi:hypothetical protein